MAIIGAGPAGITIAIILAKRGYQITVFDSRDKIGGIMRYGIPEFRLPRYILDRFEDRMKKMGIKFRFNFTIGGNITLKDLFADGYKSVFIGTGAWRPKRMLIPGETFGNVHYAISYLNNPDAVDLGQSVAIFGPGTPPWTWPVPPSVTAAKASPSMCAGTMCPPPRMNTNIPCWTE